MLVLEQKDIYTLSSCCFFAPTFILPASRAGSPVAVCLAAPEAPRPPQAIATPEAPQPSPAIAVQVRWKPAAAAYLTAQGRGKCSRRHTRDLSSTRAQLLPRPSPHALPDRTAAHAGIDTIAAVPALAAHVGTVASPSTPKPLPVAASTQLSSAKEWAWVLIHSLKGTIVN